MSKKNIGSLLGFIETYLVRITLILIGLVLAFLAFSTFPQLKNQQIIDQKSGTVIANRLPYNADNGQEKYILSNSVYNYSAQFEVHPWTQKHIKIQVEDCLTRVNVNGSAIAPSSLLRKEVIDREGYDPSETNANICSRSHQFILDLTKYVVPGTNTINLQIKSQSDKLALQLAPYFDDWIFGFCVLMSVVCFIAAYLLDSKNDQKQKGFKQRLVHLSGKLAWVSLALLALGLRIWYVSFTYYEDRSHDLAGTGHLGYIYYIADHLSIPSPGSGWEFHQAPFFYIIAGAIELAVRWFGLTDGILIQQLFQVLLGTGFVLLGTVVAHKFLSKSLTFILGLLLAVWPSLIIHSARITNDNLYNLFCLAGIFFLVQWSGYADKLQSKSANVYLFLTALAIFGALITKTSGLVLIITAFIIWGFYLYKCFSDSKQKLIHWVSKINKLPWVISIVIILAGTVISVLPKIVLASTSPGRSWLVSSSSSLNPALGVSSGVYTFASFDAQKYLETPFASPWEDSGGRQYFWVYLLKTALYGEFNYDSKEAIRVAGQMTFVFLLLVLFLILYLCNQKGRSWKQNFVLWISLLTLLASLMWYRFSEAYSCNQDFRFITPAIVPALILLLQNLEPLMSRLIGKESKLPWPRLEYFYLPLFILLAAILVFIFLSIQFIFYLSVY